MAADPDLGSLRMALRSVVAAAGATLIIGALIRLLHWPVTSLMIGVTVAMVGATLPLDVTPRARRWTLAGMPVSAAAAVVAGTLIAPHRMLGFAAFTAVIFLSVWARRFGPRGLTLGMLAFMAFFSALFFHAKAADIPGMLGGVLVGTGCLLLVRFVLFREVKERMVKAQVRALRAQAAVVLRLCMDVTRHGWRGHWMWRARHAVRRLNDLALGLEDAVQDGAPALRDWTFEFEAAVEHVTASVRERLCRGGVPAEERLRLVAALRAARAWVRGDERAKDELEAALQVLGESRIAAALRDLQPAPSPERPEPVAPVAPAMPAPPFTVKPAGGLNPNTRQAIQAAAASALAMVAGSALSKDRWVWAVIAAFVVFTRTTTSGETLLKAWQRILGTMAGIFAGLLLANIVHGHRALELSLLFGAMFVGYYLLRVSYAGFVFTFTALLAVLYSLLGRFTPGLMYLRLEETLIGAGLAAVVSAVILPTGMRDAVRLTLADLLRGVAHYLENVFAHDLSEEERLASRARARALDGRLRELRQQANPLTQSFIPVSPRLTRQVHAANTLLFYARQLARTELRASAPSQADLQLLARALAANARALAEAVDGGPLREPRETAALLGRVEAGAASSERDRLVTHALRRIDDMLTEWAGAVRPRRRERDASPGRTGEAAGARR